MMKTLRQMFLLLGLTMILCPTPLQARITEREAREFMGLYILKVKSTVTEDGVTTPGSTVIRQRMSWKGKPGSEVVEVPGGSYEPLYTRLTARSNYIRIRKVFTGSAVDEDGYFLYIRGGSEAEIRKRGRKSFNVTAWSRLSIGSSILFVTSAKGKKVR